MNNAGVSYEYPEFFHLIPNSTEKLDQLVNVNCAAMVQTTAAVIGPMSERKTGNYQSSRGKIFKFYSGLVINIGSGTGDLVCPLLSLYASTKAFVHHFTKCLRYEYENHGIHVQLISPHLVSSKMSKVRPSLFQPTPKNFVRSALTSATRLQVQSQTSLHYSYSNSRALVVTFSTIFSTRLFPSFQHPFKARFFSQCTRKSANEPIEK